MIKFALKEIEEIKGRLKFYKLLIDNQSEYDEFENKIKAEGNYLSELRTIETRMHEIAELKTLPKNKYKDITPDNDSNKEYEIKTRHLRVYLFHEKNTGRIIVSGGKKSSQQSDIKHFRSLKKSYFNQKP